jgi:hypothetical protein
MPRSYLSRNDDRFDNYRELVSRFASTGKCGHEIKKGDVIGWHRKHGAQCAACWARWRSENAEAAQQESQFNGGYESSYDNW